MPEVLLVAKDSDTSREIEELAQSHGFRVKTTFSPKQGLEWLALRSFDVLFVEHVVSFRDQQALADLLWTKDPLSSFVVYDFESLDPEQEQQFRLFGADIARGQSLWHVLERSLERAKGRTGSSQGDFAIAIVEDLDSPRDIICSYVEAMGYSSVDGYEGAEAILQALVADPKRYSCILTDIRMPKFDGKYLIEKLRSHPDTADIPIIVLTAYGTTDCLIDCLSAGASGFLVKPPKKEDLRRELSRAARIAAGHASPRLANDDEAELIRKLLT